VALLRGTQCSGVIHGPEVSAPEEVWGGSLAWTRHTEIDAEPSISVARAAAGRWGSPRARKTAGDVDCPARSMRARAPEAWAFTLREGDVETEALPRSSGRWGMADG